MLKGQRTSDLLVLVVTVLNGGNVHGGLVGEDKTAGGEVLVTGDKDGVQHGLVQQEVSHPLGDDDVDMLDGENNLLHLALDQGDNVVQLVVLDDLSGVVDNVRHVNLLLGSEAMGGKLERLALFYRSSSFDIVRQI